MQADEFAILSHKMNEHAVACSLICRKTLQPLKLKDKAKLKIAVENLMKIVQSPRVTNARLREDSSCVGDGAIDTAVYVQSKEIMLMAFKL